MQVTLSDGSVVRIRWKYTKQDKQVRISDSVITKQKKLIYDLNIDLEQKRILCEAIPTETTAVQETTTCIISDPAGNSLSEAEITRWFKDLDDKPYARKKTFKLAVEKVIDDHGTPGPLFNKEDRSRIWKEFVTKVRLPKRRVNEDDPFNLVLQFTK